MQYSEGKSFYGTPLPLVDTASLVGKLIVIEGADGSGRSTQITLLRNWLEDAGYATVEVGLKRSRLAGKELAVAMKGHTLSPITFSLFYATDFADQLEHQIVPALRAGFIVLADRYIYTLMARDTLRGAAPEWLRELYSIAIVPDLVFYFRVSPSVLAERTLRKRAVLDYWESGMDIRRSGDWYQCFVRYQKNVRKAFHRMHKTYAFEVVDGNRPPLDIAADVRQKVSAMLNRGRRLKKVPARKGRS